MNYAHYYRRENGGSLVHWTGPLASYGGGMRPSGNTETLKGWPTPAMRRAMDGDEETAYYIGTDADGSVMPTTETDE